jgi:hypothetical protein
MTTFKITFLSFFSKQNVLTANITAFDSDGVKIRLRGGVSQQEAVHLLQALGKEANFILNGLWSQTTYELVNKIPPAHKFTVPGRAAKRKLVFDSDDEEIVKMIKIE